VSISLRTHFLLLNTSLLLSLGTSVQATWQHFADFTHTQDLVATQDFLVGASTRGVWFFDPQIADWTHYSLPDGLVGVNQLHACYAGGQLFFAASDAAISSCDSAGEHWSHGFLEFREHEQIVSLHDLNSTGEHVLVSHDTGVTLMHYIQESDEFLVDWNLHTLGDFPVQEPVLAAATLGSRIVFASSLGLAVGTDFPIAPASIETFHNPSNIGTIAQARLVAGSERVYALLSDDVGASVCWSISESGAWQEEFGDLEIDEIYAHTVDGSDWALAYKSGSQKFVRSMGDHPFVWSLSDEPTAMAYHDHNLWLAFAPGDSDGGLQSVSAEGFGEFFAPDVAGAEEFVDLALADDGTLWAVGVSQVSARNGLYHWQDHSWRAYRGAYEHFGNYPTSVEADSRGSIWFGTWGRGLGRLDPLTEEWENFKHDTPNGQHFVGFYNDQVGGSSTFTLVSDVEEDEAGNIWAVNHQALDDSCVVVIPAAWQDDRSLPFARAHFEQNGLRFPYDILPTGSGSVWTSIGGKDTRDSAKRLLHLLSYGHPVSDLPQWRVNESELSSPTFNFDVSEPGLISDLAAVGDGTLWAATDNGIYYGGMYGSQEQFSRIQFIAGLLSEVVSTVTVDARGRVWLGSSEGLSLYVPADFAFKTPPVVAEFNAMAARMSDLRVHSICTDGVTGQIWVATNLGLFMSAEGGENFGDAPSTALHVYPNPLYPDRGERARVLREGLSNEAHFSIYTADGRLLRRMTLDEMLLGWDGREQSGRLVPAGVYVILAVHKGSSESTLIAVIR
jgi:hypothetical protein